MGTTIVELALPEHCRDLSAEASFGDRLRRARTLVVAQLPKLPRHLRKALRLLLQVDTKNAEGKVRCNDRKFSQAAYVRILQLYSLSSSLVNFFSLPPVVVPTCRLLRALHATDHLLHNALVNDDGM